VFCGAGGSSSGGFFAHAESAIMLHTVIARAIFFMPFSPYRC
jgi:hypothetical protein